MSMKRPSSTLGAALSTLLLLLLAFALVGAASLAALAKADSCPNAAERFGASAGLPDCRAYELVTPAYKEDNPNISNVLGFADGEHVLFDTIVPLPGANAGNDAAALSSRTSAGWVTRTLTLPQGPGEADTLESSPDQGDALLEVAFTSDFSTAFLATTFASDPLDQNRVLDVYRLNTADGTTSLASLPDSGAMTENLYHPPGNYIGEVSGSFLKGSSADGSRVFFDTVAGLPTAAGTPVETQPVGAEVYERHAEHTYLIGVLPDGSVPACGAELGEGGGNSQNPHYPSYDYGAVSADGSNVVFHTPALHESPEDTPGHCAPGVVYPRSEGALYLREDNGTPAARTVRLPGIQYLGRTADGSKILSGGDLAGDVNGGPLYKYDIATGQRTDIGEGQLLASSADGSRVYYIGHPCNGCSEQQLDVYDHGVTRTVPNAGRAYAGEFFSNGELNDPGFLGSLPVTTPDGSKLLFLDRANLTSYDSAGPGCEALNGTLYLAQNCDEAYIYDLTTGSFTCVSCSPDGTPPTAINSHLQLTTRLFFPPTTDQMVPQTTNSISADGSRAFFETTNALVPQDTNGQPDVYEWENGHIHLLSSGQGSAGSQLDGVSSNGDDVIIQTVDALLPQDVESSTQIYDARVDGGFPYTPPVYGCDSGQCQGPQTPAPVFAPPASATFVGVGNPAFLAPVSKPKTVVNKKKKLHKKKKQKVKARPKHRAKAKRRSHQAGANGRPVNHNGKGKN